MVVFCMVVVDDGGEEGRERKARKIFLISVCLGTSEAEGLLFFGGQTTKKIVFGGRPLIKIKKIKIFFCGPYQTSSHSNPTNQWTYRKTRR